MSRQVRHWTGVMAATAVLAFGLVGANDPSAAETGPLHTITVTTNSLEETLLFYRDGFSLEVEGPLELSRKSKRAQKSLWGIERDFDWDVYVLSRPDVDAAVRIRLLVSEQTLPASHASWNPLQQGPLTIGFPNQRQEQLDKEIRELGFGAINEMEVTEFTNIEGRTYPILETVFAAPDFVGAVGVARGPGEPPLAPVNAKGFGGPAYSAQIVSDMDAQLEFYTRVLGLEPFDRRVQRSTGMKGALRLPDGTDMEMVRLFSPQGEIGFMMLLSFIGLDMKEPAAPPRVPSRGIGMYSFPVSDVDNVVAKARAEGASIVHDPIAIEAPAFGSVRAATILSPSGVMIEVFETVD